MQVRSQTYKDIIADGEYSFEVELGIRDPDDTSINWQFYGMDKLFSLTTDSKIFTDRSTIGGVYSATCEFSLLGDGADIPRMAIVRPMYRVTNGTSTSEWIAKGSFNIDTRSVTDNGGGIKVFSAFCYDRMTLANKPYTDSALIWPAKDVDIITEIAHGIGCVVDGRVSNYITMERMLSEPGENETYRDYLSYIGVMYGGNWVISDDGYLEFIPLGPIQTQSGRDDTMYVSPSDITTLELAPELPFFTGVRIKTSEDTYVYFGQSTERLLEGYCPYATQEIVDYVYDHAAYGRQPFVASGVWSDPAIELGDNFVYVLDKDDPSGTQQFVGRVNTRQITFNQGMVMDITSPNDADVDHEFAYTDQTESRTDTTLGDLNNAVENLGVRNLIINTKNPDASQQANWPRLYQQLDNTRNSGWTASVAEHGIRMTKDSSTQTTLAFQMGGTTPGASTASMNGLTAGQTYTMAYGFKYLVLPADTDTTYARWRLIYYTENISGASARTQLLNRVTVRRDTETFQNVKFTFTIPEDAVVCALYFNFCDSTDTNIPNATFRSTDYFQFTNMILTEGYVAPNWIPAPEDGVADTSETVATSGTAETFDLPTSGVYLLTVNRMNSTSTTYDGAWLVSVGTSSHVFELAKGSSGPTPSVSGHTLSVTTTSANQRITITKLS